MTLDHRDQGRLPATASVTGVGRHRSRRLRTVLTAMVAVTGIAILLGACGGTEDTGSQTSPSRGGPGAPAGQGRGPGGMDFSAVQACLKAAGIDLPTPTGTFRPRGSWTGRPTGTRPPRPTRTRIRTPGQDDPGGGMFALLQRDDVKAALQACGITVPTFGRRPPGTAAPSITASS